MSSVDETVRDGYRGGDLGAAEIREAVALLPLEEVENDRMHPWSVAGTVTVEGRLSQPVKNARACWGDDVVRDRAGAD